MMTSLQVRPVWRWKSFWLGVLVLGFLAGSWPVSMKHYAGLRWVTTRWAVVAGAYGGKFVVSYHDVAVEPPLGLRADSGPVANERVFQQAIVVRRLQDGMSFYAAVAHWFLIALFLLVWVLFLLVRRRRMRSLAMIPE